MKNLFFYDTEMCKLGIADNGTAITNLYFCKKDNVIFQDDIQINETSLIKEALKQINEYFAGRRKIFELPLAPNGTEFQLKVWKALQQIPIGETRSYGEIASIIGNPKASRAVGMANNKNPIPIFIPCHRVIGANGSLVGYAGGLEIKKYLLEKESIHHL